MQIEAAARILFFGFTSGLGLALGMELGKEGERKGREGLPKGACLLAAACERYYENEISLIIIYSLDEAIVICINWIVC